MGQPYYQLDCPQNLPNKEGITKLLSYVTLEFLGMVENDYCIKYQYPMPTKWWISQQIKWDGQIKFHLHLIIRGAEIRSGSMFQTGSMNASLIRARIHIHFSSVSMIAI